MAVTVFYDRPFNSPILFQKKSANDCAVLVFVGVVCLIVGLLWVATGNGKRKQKPAILLFNYISCLLFFCCLSCLVRAAVVCLFISSWKPVNDRTVSASSLCF